MMYNRIFYFLNSFNLLYKYQFGFREQYGTNMVLFVLVDEILKAIDYENIIPGIYLDLNKEFDTVDHPISLKKTFKYGIRGFALNWMRDYLKDRKQYVFFNGRCSW